MVLTPLMITNKFLFCDKQYRFSYYMHGGFSETLEKVKMIGNHFCKSWIARLYKFTHIVKKFTW